MACLKLVSFNLRCAWTGDGINSFLHRVGLISHKIIKERPDVICFQEGTVQNVDALRRVLYDYEIVFNQRDATFCGEGLAIAFLREKLELIGLECFWLSKTPNVPGSRYDEQSAFPRICQSALLKCDDKVFRIYNNHLDHLSEQARVIQIKQVIEKINKDCDSFDCPFFVCGDFNAEPQSETIALCDNFVKMKDLTAGCDGTFHNFGKLDTPKKIDYIFTDKNTYIAGYNVIRWTDNKDGIFLSDHYPIFAQVNI